MLRSYCKAPMQRKQGTESVEKSRNVQCPKVFSEICSLECAAYDRNLLML
jgi:hypothetical protein